MRKPNFSIAKLFATICLVVIANTSLTASETEFDLSAYEGKVVFLDFWASWCVPCLRSFPWMNSMHDKYADDGLVIIAINVDNELDAARTFLAEHPPNFQIYYDLDKQLAKEYEVQVMPSSYLIGRDGTRHSQHVGFKVRRQDEYEAAIIAALHETGVSE